MYEIPFLNRFRFLRAASWARWAVTLVLLTSSTPYALAQSTPTAPTWLRVTPVSASQIDLRWDDNSNNESGFRVERKKGAAGPWTLVATTGPNAITHADNGLDCNTTYAYRVWAFNASGNSATTNEANTTTLACAPPPPPTSPQEYPLAPDSPCGNLGTCVQVLERWNDASWADLVDDSFDTEGSTLATVRWYEGEHLKELKRSDHCPLSASQLDEAGHRFCSVTDELSNVLLSHAMDSDQANYEKLHNFTELLRHPEANNLQCWIFQLTGRHDYDGPEDLCIAGQFDSASDASLRILGAYGIACAKQSAGEWTQGAVDYCADYREQGEAIWGNLLTGSGDHGEIKRLPNSEYFLAGGYRNWQGAPTGADSFWPDYLELQFLMDFAKYLQLEWMKAAVIDFLRDYRISLGDNHIHRGKRGHFDINTQIFTCDGQLCAHPYMDNIDTWRAIPAITGLFNVHPDRVPTDLKTDLFDYWWRNYGAGHRLYGPTADKPFEIYAWSSDGKVKYAENSYKTLAMWIPLGAAFRDKGYVSAALKHLADDRYLTGEERFDAATYYGAYFSQFAQRAIGAATGMIDPAFWSPDDFPD